MRVVEACARRIGTHDADLDHDHFSAFHFARVERPYFTGSSLILSPPFATGMTQIGVATSAEPRRYIRLVIGEIMVYAPERVLG